MTVSNRDSRVKSVDHARDCPIFRPDIQIRKIFRFPWMAGLEEAECSDLGRGSNTCTHKFNDYSEVYRFSWPWMFGFRGRWVNRNLNIVRICKSVRNIGRSLSCMCAN